MPIIEHNQRFPISMPQPLRFLLLFVFFYCLLEGLYFAVPDDFLRGTIYHFGIVAVSADIIHLATPGEPVMAVVNRLRSDTTTLEIIRGCDGAGVAFLLISAILSFPVPPFRKLFGSLLAIVLVFFLNQVRIVGLYYIGVYKKAWFVPVHIFLAPTLMIAVSCTFFVWWIMSGQTEFHESPESL